MLALRTAALAALVTAACFGPQDPAPADPACPHLQIRESEAVPAGTQARVHVSVIGDTAGVQLHWKVTDGIIAAGQGTDTILIDTANLAGKTIRADLELVGLPAACATRGASTFVLVGPATVTSAN